MVLQHTDKSKAERPLYGSGVFPDPYYTLVTWWRPSCPVVGSQSPSQVITASSPGDNTTACYTPVVDACSDGLTDPKT